MNVGPGRTIRKSRRFDDEANAIDADVHRMDDALRYVEAVLSEDPEAGLRTMSPAIRIAPMVFLETTSGTVGASIYYSYDDTFVDLLSIQRDW